MEKKNYKLIKDKLYRIKVKILITLSLSFICVQSSFSIDYIEVWPYEIKFNYEPGHINDALNIRKTLTLIFLYQSGNIMCPVSHLHI